MQVDDAFNNLRHKLDVLGYNQTFPLSAFALVGALFEDLVKTTESLRDAKHRIGKLLEEKACWELGVEPYKCDNSRLLAECNSLHLEVIRQSEEFENKEIELASRVRKTEADKSYLQEHCAELENRIRLLSSKLSDPKSLKHKKDGVNMSKKCKKPFVSTVPVGTLLPNPNAEFGDKTRCPKCNHIAWAKHGDTVAGYDIRQVQNEKKDLVSQIASYKRKVEIRDREISRLHELLSGGRPPAALAKDCCYKNIEILNEDVDVLQKEKLEMTKQLRNSQEKMHEAMQRAVKLEEDNKLLSKQLKDLQQTALRLEKQANFDIIEKDQEISQLKHELRHLKLKSQPIEERSCKSCSAKSHLPNGINRSKSNICQKCLLQKDLDKSLAENKKLENQIQILLEKERDLSDLSEEYEKLKSKNLELQQKITQLDKEKVDMQRREANSMLDDDDYNRLKLERDFFQKEYLQIVKKSANEKEMENLQAQLKMKEQEIKKLRHELLEAQIPTSARSDHSMSNASVQATILRAERERDAVKSALSLAQMEKESLAESLKITKQTSLSEKDRYEQEIKEKEVCIQELKAEIRKIKSGLGWQNSLKEQNEELNKKLAELESENTRLLSLYNKLKMLQEQTERALIDHQNRLVVSESQLESATSRLNTLDTNRESARNESSSLRTTVSELRSRNHLLENEKENLIMDLDAKTEKIARLEKELKIALKNKEDFSMKVEKLQTRLEKVQNDSKERENEFETSTLESKSLRKELAAIKLTRDQTLEENNRIISELAEANADLTLVQHRLKESQREVDNLKLQLQQYVQEVQRAEELLMLKEREREEMLEHYRSLTHDAVVLEGTHHSLEMEAAEQKRLLAEAEFELIRLKKEMGVKNETLEKLQKQVTCLSGQVIDLENELERTSDDRRLIKADLEAMKDLCGKLDLQRDKLNAEIEECVKIRKQLEFDNEKLRKELVNIQSGDKTVIESLRELLSTSREELDNQRKISNNLNQEVLKLKEKISELQEKLIQEREESKRNEALVHEYSVQIQELRHSMANDRFEMARSREESARVENNLKSYEVEVDDYCEINNLDAEITGIYVSESQIKKTISKDKLEVENRNEILSKVANFLKMDKQHASKNPHKRRGNGSIETKTKIPTKHGRTIKRRNIEPQRRNVEANSASNSNGFLKNGFDTFGNTRKLKKNSIKESCSATSSGANNKENSLLHRSGSYPVQEDSKQAVKGLKLSVTKSEPQFSLENNAKTSDLSLIPNDRNQTVKSLDGNENLCTEASCIDGESETNALKGKDITHNDMDHSSTLPQKHKYEMGYEAKGLNSCSDSISISNEQPTPNFTLCLKDHIFELDNGEIPHTKYVSPLERKAIDVSKTPSTSSFNGCECMKEKYIALKKIILQK